MYEGAKAVIDPDGLGSNVQRPLTTALSGDGNVVYTAVRRSVNNAGQLQLAFNAASSNRRVTISLNSSGNIVGEATTILAGYSVDTWYVLRITLNTDADTYTVATSTDAYGTAGTFSADSLAIAMTGTSSADIVAIQFNVDIGGNNYYDYISPTSPFVASGISTRKALLGVGI